MKKIIPKVSEFSKRTKIIVIVLVGIVIFSLAISFYLDTSFHQERAISKVMEQHSYINNWEVHYDESQDKYIIEALEFQQMSPSGKFLLSKDISSQLKGKTNFIIKSHDKEYSYRHTIEEGLIIYEDGSKSYSEEEKGKASSAYLSIKAKQRIEEKQSGNTDYGPSTQVKTEKTCEWAGCYNDRKGLNEYCSYHTDYLNDVSEAVEGF